MLQVEATCLVGLDEGNQGNDPSKEELNLAGTIYYDRKTLTRADKEEEGSSVVPTHYV